MKALRIRSKTERSHLVALVLLAFFSFAQLPNQARTQDFLSWIDADSALVCHVCDPHSVFEYLESFDHFRNPYWNDAFKLITEPPFALLEAKDVKAIGDLLTKWKQTFDQIEEAIVVLHEFEPTKVEFTCLVKVREGFGDSFLKIVQETQDRFKSVRNNVEEQAIGSLLKGQELYHVEAGNWFLISNSEARMSDIADRIQGDTDPEIRSMRDSRKFQIVMRTFEQNRLSRPAVRVIGNPSRLRALFPRLSEIAWNRLLINELPSFGSQVYLLPNTNSESNGRLALVADTHINATIPRSGMAQIWECNRAIPSLPPVPDKIISFVASNHDPAELFDVLSKDSSGHSDQTSYANWAKDQYAADLYGALSGFAEKQIDEVRFQLWLIDESTSKREALTILPIQSSLHAMAMKGLFDRTDAGLLEGRNEYRKVDFDFGRLYVLLDGRYPAGKERSIYLDENWIIEGSHDTVTRYVRQMRDESPQLGETKFFANLHKLKDGVKLECEPFGIEFLTARSRLNRVDYLIPKAEIQTPDGKILRFGNTPQDKVVYDTEVRSEAERDSKFLLLIKKGLYQSLGDQLTLTTQTDNQIRIVHGLFDQAVDAGN